MANRYLVLYSFPRGGEAEPRVGLSVGRKVGGAVQRNRVKRLLREAVAASSADLPRGLDLVLVARADAAELAESRGAAGVGDAVGELFGKAGLAGAGP